MLRQTERLFRWPCIWTAIVYFIAAFSVHPAYSSEGALSKEELTDGWIRLFDGATLFGWKAATKADWQAADGVLSVSAGEPGLLYTSSQFGDFILSLDFRAEADTNSGIFLRTSPRPSDPQRDCYELNIATPAVSPFPTGSFVGRAKRASGEDSTKWRHYEVTAAGARFQVKLDGQTVLDYTDPKPRGRGYIGLQFNSGAVEFRDIKLKPLGEKPIFNGQDLEGWRIFPGKKSVFSVTDEGYLSVKNGNGQLETQGRYADFTLQLEVLANGKHLNSGIFFRSLPGEFWQGYESQIHNGHEDGDPNKPLDYGTGGFYRRQKARKVVADDFEWFCMTLVVAGNHMATWVNGYQVSAWSDPRDPHENPRQGRRLEPGTLIIQGHDPTTDLLFRNIRIAEIPPR